MALTKDEAQRLADLLPDDLRCTNARERLLCVLVALQTLTDADHVLSNADLRAILQERFGAHNVPAENTLSADIHALANSGYPDLHVHLTPSGCWCEHERLSPAKVRLLLNAVQSSRFLTIEQSSELQEDLFGLVSRHQEEALAGQVLVDQRVHKSYQQVFAGVDTITRAIRLDRKIEFRYTYSDFAGRSHELEGDNGSTLRIETPIALYFSENNYYVETYTSTPWRHGIKVILSRVDRMTQVGVSSQRADRSRTVYDLRRSARKRLTASFDMISGPLRWTFVRVRSDATNVLYDRFGFGFRFGQFEGVIGTPEATGLTLLRVPQAFTFYRWLSAVGQGIIMVEPPDDMTLRTGPWARALSDVSRSQLDEDHRALVEGFLAYLDRARAPYA